MRTEPVLDFDEDGNMPDRPSDPTGRVLQLLSLLQTHRRWNSDELAHELAVTPRTVRRDIERLRVLGYPVEASPGVDGGYRLAAGAHLPPLMFDDDEAVALAVGLWTVSSSPLAGVEETSLRALAKVEALMPDRVRRRTTAITSSVSTHRWHDHDVERVDIETVSVVTSACRDREELRFAYVSKTGETTDRLVEPHRLVAIEQRWYLLAWDLRRSDWRTFRLDRIERARAAGARFEPRPIPGGDPAAFVVANLGGARSTCRATVRVGARLDDVHAVAPWLTDDATVRGERHVDLRLRGQRIEHLVSHTVRLASAFDVEVVGDSNDDHDLRSRLAAVAERLTVSS